MFELRNLNAARQFIYRWKKSLAERVVGTQLRRFSWKLATGAGARPPAPPVGFDAAKTCK